MSSLLRVAAILGVAIAVAALVIPPILIADGPPPQPCNEPYLARVGQPCRAPMVLRMAEGVAYCRCEAAEELSTIQPEEWEPPCEM